MSPADGQAPADGQPPAEGQAPAGPATLAQWLAHIETLHGRPMDLGLERVRDVAGRMALNWQAITFTVAGTNGKGSTCHMLEAIVRAAGYRVGCYTSPHLLRFNERARVDGVPVGDEELVEQLRCVDAARGATTLTYFEFTTLAILGLFVQRGVQVAVLEIGLGGRLDAVNIVDADCALITSIDIDHADLLGHTREAIGLEKAHIMRPGRPAVVADPEPPASVVEHAQATGADLWLNGRDYRFAGDRSQWSWAGRQQRRSALAYPALRGANQLLNAAGVLAALEALRTRLPVNQQAVREGLANVHAPGRFQVLPGQPAVVLDVGHNPHAAAHLARNLGSMGFFPYTHAVFGMLADKDVDAVIARLRDVVDHWVVCSLPGPRGMTAADLRTRLLAQGIGADTDAAPQGRDAAPTVCTAEGPAEALQLALERATPQDRIVVFGSFLTVAGVLDSVGARRVLGDSA